MIDNLEQLIQMANKIDNETERLTFIMNYFLETVQYDYSYLLLKGYLQGTIAQFAVFDPEVDIIENPLSKGTVTINYNGEKLELNDNLCKTIRITIGESKLLDEMDKLYHNSNGSVDEFFDGVRKLFYDEMIKHLDNEELVKENVEIAISVLKQNMNAGSVFLSINSFLGNDIKRNVVDILLEPNKHMPPVIENGLIKRGVCQHFADYLADVLPKCGISARRVDGTSEMGHAWIAAVVDGQLKSVDLTRALFIKDHFVGIPENQKSSDWLICSFEDSFRMQPTRTVTKVDVLGNGELVDLPYVMNAQNFNESIIMDYFDEPSRGV